jgi:osmoprotectant transport system permease protein
MEFAMADIQWAWIGRHGSEIGRSTEEHLVIVAISMVMAAVVALPLAVSVRGRRLGKVIATGTATLLYSIPSLALFAILVSIIGIGRLPAVVALASYAVGILLRSTLTGLQQVPTASLEAARGLGFTRRQVLTRVELPLAWPAILSGLRLATVETVAIATIAVFVAGGGLGSLIFTDGISRDLFLTPILVGSVLAVVLALALDSLFVLLKRVTTPWLRRGGT